MRNAKAKSGELNHTGLGKFFVSHNEVPGVSEHKPYRTQRKSRITPLQSLYVPQVPKDEGP